VLSFLKLINSHLEQTQEGYGVSDKFLEEMVVSKIQHCISGSGSAFCDKALPLLKSLMITYALIASQDENTYR